MGKQRLRRFFIALTLLTLVAATIFLFALSSVFSFTLILLFSIPILIGLFMLLYQSSPRWIFVLSVLAASLILALALLRFVATLEQM